MCMNCGVKLMSPPTPGAFASFMSARRFRILLPLFERAALWRSAGGSQSLQIYGDTLMRFAAGLSDTGDMLAVGIPPEPSAETALHPASGASPAG